MKSKEFLDTYTVCGAHFSSRQPMSFILRWVRYCNNKQVKLTHFCHPLCTPPVGSLINMLDANLYTYKVSPMALVQFNITSIEASCMWTEKCRLLAVGKPKQTIWMCFLWSWIGILLQEVLWPFERVSVLNLWVLWIISWLFLAALPLATL